uniref:Uncharacterized protein n=2 Tax=Acidianus TaxID=12914 RepID=A0A2U9IJL4_9CREN
MSGFFELPYTIVTIGLVLVGISIAIYYDFVGGMLVSLGSFLGLFMMLSLLLLLVFYPIHLLFTFSPHSTPTVHIITPTGYYTFSYPEVSYIIYYSTTKFPIVEYLIIFFGFLLTFLRLRK